MRATTTNLIFPLPFENLHRIEQILPFQQTGDDCDLRFLRPFPVDLSIRKSSSFFPLLTAATSQRGLAGRPAQVSPEGPRYLGGTLSSPQCASTASHNPCAANHSNCPVHPLQPLSISARCSRSISSTRLQRSSLIDLPLP